jgi:hypothetical protein
LDYQLSEKFLDRLGWPRCMSAVHLSEHAAFGNLRSGAVLQVPVVRILVFSEWFSLQQESPSFLFVESGIEQMQIELRQVGLPVASKVNHIVRHFWPFTNANGE